MIPEAIRSFVFDIDGCLAVDGEPIEGTIEALRELGRRRRRFVMFTNDSLLSPTEWAGKVRSMGLDLPDLRVITAGELLVQLVAERRPGSRALVLGPETIASELRARGVEPVEPARAREADVVVVARDPGFDYETMTAGVRALLAGASLFTASMARTIPSRDGPVPGTGATTKALSFAGKARPVVAGKPSAVAARLCMRLAGFERAQTAFVGDDAELDVATGKLARAFTILVLSGTTRAEEVASLAPRLRPDIVVPSVADIPSLLEGARPQGVGPEGARRAGMPAAAGRG